MKNEMSALPRCYAKLILKASFSKEFPCIFFSISSLSRSLPHCRELPVAFLLPHHLSESARKRRTPSRWKRHRDFGGIKRNWKDSINFMKTWSLPVCAWHFFGLLCGWWPTTRGLVSQPLSLWRRTSGSFEPNSSLIDLVIEGMNNARPFNKVIELLHSLQIARMFRNFITTA